jgi:HEAT repeat protein
MLMQDACELAVALSELILQLSESPPPDSLRSGLVAVCARVAAGDTILEVRRDVLHVGDAPLEVSADAVQSLLAAMRRHELASIAIESTATPRELLLLGNVLSEAAPQGDAAAARAQRLDRRLLELGCWHVVPRLRTDVETVADGGVASHTATRPAVSAALAAETTEAALAVIEDLTRALQLHRVQDDALGTALLLHDVVLIERRVAVLGDGAAELSALWAITFDQFATPGALRLVATLLAGDAIERASLLAVMLRAGDIGAGALIAQLITETDRAKRRELYDAIVHVRAGLPLLLRSLQHPTWYVVRNAVSLLGAMHAPNVESQLAMTLAHSDERVRLAATSALSRLGTPAALAALGSAMRDKAAAVRHRAFRHLRKALGTGIGATVVADALELERHPATQRELLDALLASTSPETVQRLVRLCSPSSRGAFSAELRVSMFEALIHLRPAAAMPILRMAAEDRDPVVRSRARELMATPVVAT